MLNHKVNFWIVAQNGPKCGCIIAKAVLLMANIYWAGHKENFKT